MGRAGSRRVRTGIALSVSELCAADVRLGGSAGWRRGLEAPDGNGGWPSLEQALRDLGAALGETSGRLVIALMPPLTEVRKLDLPPLRPEAMQQLLSRNASRYFVTAREPQFVGTSIVRRNQNGGPAPVVGAAAAARLVSAIYAAAGNAGWTVDAVVPAEVAWRAAATTMWPSYARGDSYVLVHHADRTDLLQLTGGNLTGVRHFRPGSRDADLIAKTLEDTRANGTAPRVAGLGETASRMELARALPRSGLSVEVPPPEWNGATADPMLLAATFATPDEGLALRTHDVAALRVARGRRVTARIAAAVLGLMIASAALAMWDLQRELDAVTAERARLRPRLEATLAGKTTFDASTKKLSALFAMHRESPYLSGVIAGVTDALPQDAYLASFRARRDTLVLDGLAAHAAAAFDGIAAIPELANVRSASGVQRQLQDDGTALEHFTIQARMLLPPAPPLRRTTR